MKRPEWMDDQTADLRASIAAAHHLTWLAVDDLDEGPLTTVDEFYGHMALNVAESTNHGFEVEPARWVAMAKRLLWLAVADGADHEDSEEQRKAIATAERMLEVAP